MNYDSALLQHIQDRLRIQPSHGYINRNSLPLALAYDDLRELYGRRNILDDAEDPPSPVGPDQVANAFAALHRRRQRHMHMRQEEFDAFINGDNGLDAPSGHVRAAHRRPVIGKKEDVPEPSAPEGTKEKKLCVVCLDRVKVVALIPCGHMCMCVTCARAPHGDCPLCRASVTGTLRVFV